MSNAVIPDDFFILSSALFCLLNREGRVLRVNHAWEKRLGITPLDLEDTDFYQWIHPQEIGRVRVHFKQLNQGALSINFIGRWRVVGHHYRWLQWEVSQSTDFSLWYAVATDISTQKQIEQELRQIEERFQLAMQGANHGLWDWDLLTNEVYLSPRWKSLIGYADHEIVNHIDALCQYVHPDDFTQMWGQLEAYLDKRLPNYENVHRLKHQDGSYRWVLARAAALWDSSGQPYRMVGVYLDLTAYKHTEEERDRLLHLSIAQQEALKRSEARYRAIVEDQIDLLCRFLPDGSLTFVNQAYCRFFGKTEEQLLGKPCLPSLSAQDRENFLGNLARLTPEQPVAITEHLVIDAEGQKRWQQWFDRAMFDENFLLLEYQGVGRDITKRKQAEEALLHSEERLRFVTSAAPIILFALDTNGVFTFARGKALSMVDSSDDALVGRSVFTDSTYLSEEITSLRRALLGETVSTVTVLTNHVSDDKKKSSHSIAKVVLETKFTPLFDQQQQVIGVIGFSIDITSRYTLELKLHEAVAELETILDNSIVGIAYIRNGYLVRTNRKLETLLNYEPNELNGRPFQCLYPSVENYHQMRERVLTSFEQGKDFDTGCLLQRNDGTVFWARLVSRAVDTNDLSKGIIWLVEDLTSQKQAEQNLRLAATVFETTVDGIMVTDLQKCIQRVNPAFTKITGYSAEEAQGKKTRFLSSGRHDTAFYQKIWESINSTGHWQGEIWNRRKNGDIYIAWLSISAITDENNRVVQYMAVLSDISRLQEDIENARYLANYDSLTNLPNRAFFQDSLLQARNRAVRCNRSFGLLFIDLDGFKQINDKLGHGVGDQLLRSVADRLRHCVRETDVVARIGGDEFTIILNNLRFTQDAGRVAEKVVKTLEIPFEIENHVIEISASVGITVYPTDSHQNIENIEELIKQADSAMYRAKNAGKGSFRFYHKTE